MSAGKKRPGLGSSWQDEFLPPTADALPQTASREPQPAQEPPDTSARPAGRVPLAAGASPLAANRERRIKVTAYLSPDEYRLLERIVAERREQALQTGTGRQGYADHAAVIGEAFRGYYAARLRTRE